MLRLDRWLPLTILLVACGESTNATEGLTVLVDDQDYGADSISATLGSTVAGTWELVLYAHLPEDDAVADDEGSLALHLVLDDLDQRSNGDTLVLSSSVAFTSEFASVLIDVSSSPHADRDPTVQAAYVRQYCFCFSTVWPDQVLTGTLRLDSVSTNHVEATIDVETSGGLPFYGSMLGPGSHTTRFEGSFATD